MVEKTQSAERLTRDEAIIGRVREIVGAAYVLTTPGDLLAYSRDCWPRLNVQMRDGRWPSEPPLCVVQPGSVKETRELVRVAEEHETPLVPFGAGSGVCGAAVPVGRAITVDCKRLRRVEIDGERMLVHVGPGVIGQHLEETLLAAGLTLGHYPSSLSCSTVGGYLAGRSAGQYSSRYGKIEDMVSSLQVVVGGGEVVDTGTLARESGVDLLQLVVGSEGTLGIITDATLRVHPAPEARWYRGYMMPTVEAGVDAMRVLMQAGLRPAVVRLYDELDTVMAGTKPTPGEPTSAPGLVRHLARHARERLAQTWDESALSEVVDRAGRALMGRILGQPLVVSKAIDLIPGGCMLIVGFEGSALEVQRESNVAVSLLETRGRDLGAGPGEHWYAHRFAISYKMSAVMDTGAFTDTMEVSTRWSELLALYRAVRAALAPRVVVMAHFSHAYRDGCSIYFTFAGFEPTLDALLERYDKTWEVGLTTVAGQGASVAHHHGVGVSKARFVAFDHPGGRPLFDALKQAFDPSGIFNPGTVWASEADTP